MGQRGSRLEDRYFVQKVKLGQGSFGTVWRAVDNETKQMVAIKQIDKTKMHRKGVTREHTAREISMLKACNHINITSLYHTYEDANNIYLALEYCDGGDFGDKIRERAATLGEHEAADWMRQIISAIAALHKRDICHRDIKPDNFMLSGEHLKLSDFGLAVHLPHGKLLHEKCGTPAFMAPEQYALPKSEGYGRQVDIWAAGVLGFMIICGGRHPFVRASQVEMDIASLMRGELHFDAEKKLFSFDFMKASKSRFSEDARLFCRHLVDANSASRPSAEKTLEHRWLNVQSASCVERLEEVDKSTTAYDTVGQMVDSWVAVGKAAKEAAAESIPDKFAKVKQATSEATGTAPARLSRALGEGMQAMQPPSRRATVSTNPAMHERQQLEVEVLGMGATLQELEEMRELLEMDASVHDVRQSMRRRLAGRVQAPLADSDAQEVSRSELAQMGFAPMLVEHVARHGSTSAEAVNWILGFEGQPGNDAQKRRKKVCKKVC